ncbi:hypothetical protein J4427_01430 [Candidatus Woesearchaeota archaeon]|nr:hypothetical protein [Candidatus Woesearchaeota archaeon]
MVEEGNSEEKPSKKKRVAFWFGRRIRGVGRGVESVSREGAGGGFSLGFGIVRRIIKFLGFFAGLFVAYIVLSIIWSAFITGQIPEYAAVGLERIGLLDFAVNAADKIYSISSGNIYKEENAVGFSGTTRTVKEAFGIEIQEFAPDKKVYQLNEPIRARALVKVIKTPEDEDISLDFRDACYLEDYTDIETPKEVVVNPEDRIITNQENYIFPVWCEFKHGFSEILYYSGATDVEAVKEKTSIKKTSDLKVLRFTPRFSYSQFIGWQPFIKETYEPDDKIREPTWDVSEGPASLRVGSDESQPFYKNDQHELKIILTKNWPGSIKSLNSVVIGLTEGIELLTDNKFCDFALTSYGYVLKAPALEETKIDCSSSSTLEKLKALTPFKSDVTIDQCIKQYKSEFKFSCPFIVTSAEQIASRTQVNVKASYIYEMSDANTITIVDSETQTNELEVEE